MDSAWLLVGGDSATVFQTALFGFSWRVAISLRSSRKVFESAGFVGRHLIEALDLQGLRFGPDLFLMVNRHDDKRSAASSDADDIVLGGKGGGDQASSEGPLSDVPRDRPARPRSAG